MDGIRSFFAKYHAVRGNESGPRWGTATNDVLVGWAMGDVEAWHKTTDSEQDRGHLKARMVEIVKELWKRMKGVGVPEDSTCPEYKKLRRAWFNLSILVGFEHSV